VQKVKLFFIATPGSRVIARKGGIYVVKRLGEGIEKVAIPPDVDAIVIASSRVGISSKAIRLAASRGIDVVFLDSTGYPVARVYPPYISKTIATRVAQYTLFPTEFGKRLAKELIYAKIVNQAEVVRYLAKNYRDASLREEAYRVDSVATEIRSLANFDADTLRNLEARAAKIYWQAIAYTLPKELGFTGRDHDSKDPFNMALNYGYAILYTTCEKALLLAGLDPYLGVFHTPKSGKPSLTLDFVEMFRAVAIDKPLAINAKRIRFEVSENRLDYETRKEVARTVLENISSSYFYAKANKRLELGEIIKRESWDLAMCIREAKEYRGFRASL
jgi:CRISPR-associated protein Cas1